LSNKSLYYFAFFDEQLNIVNIKQMDSTSNTNTAIFATASSPEFLYVAGYMQTGVVKLGDFTLTNNSSNRNLFIAKMDTLGNFLWAFNNEESAANIFDINIDLRGNVYVVGIYSDSVQIFDKSEGGTKSDGYLAKIT